MKKKKKEKKSTTSFPFHFHKLCIAKNIRVPNDNTRILKEFYGIYIHCKVLQNAYKTHR